MAHAAGGLEGTLARISRFDETAMNVGTKLSRRVNGRAHAICLLTVAEWTEGRMLTPHEGFDGLHAEI